MILIYKDKRGTNYNNTKAMEVLEDIMNENYMVDIWRIRNPEKILFTWSRNNPTKILSRLDYFITTSSVAE